MSEAGRSDEVVLKVEDISLSFGGVKAITDVSFDVKKGEVRAIIGPTVPVRPRCLTVLTGSIIHR